MKLTYSTKFGFSFFIPGGKRSQVETPPTGIPFTQEKRQRRVGTSHAMYHFPIM